MSEPVLSRKRQGAQDAVDTQADEHLFDYLREDLLDLVFFARQDSTQIFILRRSSPRRTSV